MSLDWKSNSPLWLIYLQGRPVLLMLRVLTVTLVSKSNFKLTPAYLNLLGEKMSYNICLSSQSDPPDLSDGVTSRYQSVPHQPNIASYKYQPAAVELSLPQHQVMTPSVQGVEYEDVGCSREAHHNSQEQH